MPKVLISWSGKDSHKVATTLYNWLPVVLQSVKPFVSSEDLKKGGRWVAELSVQLETDNFGILCLTPNNLLAPWVLFEAGALSKSVGDSHVAPFLVGVKPSELPAPLTQFNAVQANKEDFKKLVRAVNESVMAEQVAQDRIDRAVEACWSQIEAELTQAVEPREVKDVIEPKDIKVEGLEKFDTILQELLTLNRNQSSLLNSPDKLLPRGYLNVALRSTRGELPSAGHRAWQDLIEGARDVRAMLRNAEQDAPQNEAIERLLNAAEFITHRLDSHHRQYSMRRTWTEPEKLLELPSEENKEE